MSGLSGLDSGALYRLVVSQLADDGHVGAAAAVAAATCTPQHTSAALPRHALLQLVNGRNLDPLAPGVASLRAKREAAAYRPCCAEDVGSQRVVTRFSTDGRQLAVGTSDGTVHVLDAQALLNGKGSAESAFRRYSDHSGAVNDLEYHPANGILVTASEDSNLHFYDVANGTQQAGPARMCTDTHPVRSVAFHPKGEHLLVGTTHAALHLYDVASFRCFLSPDSASHHHGGAITDARRAPSMNLP